MRKTITFLSILMCCFMVTNLYADVDGNYRAVATGDWSDASIWQRHDGSTWQLATVSPDATNAETIRILSPYIVTITATLTVDQVVIDPGAQVVLNAPAGTLTIADGIGDDLVVNGLPGNNGIFANRDGSIVINTGATMVFTADARYVHERNGDVVPVATWQTNSSCYITGMTTTSPTGLDQNFYNLIWDNAGQTANGDMPDTDYSIAGTLRVENINGQGLYLLYPGRTGTVANYIQNDGNVFMNSHGGNRVFNVDISFTLNIGTFRVLNGSGTFSSILNIGGDFTQAGGTLTRSTTDATPTAQVIFNGSAQQTLSQTGGIVSGGIDFVVNNAAGLLLNTDFTLSADATIAFTNGLVTTGPNTLIVPNDDPLAATGGSFASFVDGNLQRALTSGAYNFPVGNNPYTPVQVDFASGSETGTLVASTIPSDHPNIVSSDLLDDASVNRYWTLDFTPVGTGTFTYDATFTWVGADEDLLFDWEEAFVGKYDVGWTYPVPVTRTASSAKITGQTSFSDFQVANGQLPVFVSCPEDIIQDNDPGVCSAVVNYDADVTIDYEDDVNYVFEGATTGSGSGTGSGSVFNVGLTTVTLTAENIFGSATCVFTITIEDNEDPEFVNFPADANASPYKTGVWTFDSEPTRCGTDVSWETVIADDNCSVITITLTDIDTDPPVSLDVDPYPGTTSGFFGVGNTVVTYTIEDEHENIVTGTFTVTVIDVHPPVLTGGTSTTKTADAAYGICTATVSWDAPLAEDACPLDLSTIVTYPDGSIYTLSFTTTVYDFPIGTSTVTFIASDSNNTTTQSFNVIVTDTQNPTFTCPVADGTTYAADNDSGVCYATLDFTLTDADDNCGVSTITYYVDGSPEVVGTLASGTLTATFEYEFPVGTSTVLVEVWDVNGNIATCTFDVEVTDIEPPVVTTQPYTLELDSNGEATLDVNDVFVDATDNCDVVTSTLAVSPDYFTCADLGVNVVTVTIQDVNGLWGSATAEVTVVDLISPTFTYCPTDQDVFTASNTCSYTHEGIGWDATANDNCGSVTLTYSLDGATTAITVSNTSIDGQVFEAGVTTVTWLAEDPSGNYTLCVFVVTVEDNYAPTLSCVGDQVVDTDPGICSYAVQGTEFDAFDVDDNCGVITLSWELSGDTSGTGLNTLDGVVLEKGVTTVVWTATDAALNATTCTFTVTVEDNEAPVFDNCPGPALPAVTAGASCRTTVEWDPITANDNCTDPVTIVATFSDGPAGFDGPNSNGKSWREFDVGIHTAVFVATDGDGNSSTCTFTITVHSQSLPVADAQSITRELDETGNVSITADDVDVASTIGCYDPPADNISDFLSLSQYDFDCSHVGVNTIVFTVTDKTLRTATQTIYVTIEDNTPPVVDAEPVVDIYVDEFGDATLLVEDAYIDATDACGIVTSTMYVDPASFTCIDIGAPITYTLWVEDVNGNWGTAQGLVNVHDNLPPVMACTITGTLAVGTSTSTCDYTHADASWDLSATDNCGAVTVTYSLAGVTTVIDALNTTLAGQVFNLGVTTVTWTAVDAYDNMTSCTFAIEVVDDVYPTIACVTDTFRYNDTGECTYTVVNDEFDPDFDDNCSATIEHDYALAPVSSTLAGAEFPIGETDVIWTVTDGAGNQVTCVITIQVDDQDDPIWDYAWNVAGSKYCGDNTTTLIGCNPLFQWRRPDLTDLSDCTAIIRITEVISDAAVQSNVESVYGVYDFTDPLGASVNLTPGIYTFTYTAEDAYGNTAECYFVVTVDDGQDPSFDNCPEPREIAGCTVNDITYPDFSEVMTQTTREVFRGDPNLGEEVDNCMPVAEFWYQDEVVSTVACPIVVERTWTIVDGSGRTATCVQTITVNEEEPPTLIDPNALIALGGDQGNVCMADMPTAPVVDDIAALYEDNCTVTPTASYDGPLYGVENTNCSWIVTYTYTVYDDCMNETSAEVVYWGGDSEAPSLVSPTLTSHEVLSVETLTWCLDVAEAFDPTTLESAVADLYEDNCTTPTAQWIGTESGTFNTNCDWEFVYTFEVTDGCNTVTCTVTYSGGDEEAPLLVGTLPGGDVGNVCYDDRPEAPAPAVIAAEYTDNCGTVSATLIGTEVTGSDCGWTVTYTYTVDDGCDNYAPNAVVVYTGADSEGPVVENAEELQWVFECADAVPAALDLSIYADIVDNCSSGPFGIVLVSELLDPQDNCQQARTITRTYTITDPCDNPTTFVQVIRIQDNIPPSLIDPLVTCESLHMTGENSLDLCYAEAALIDTDAIAADVASLYEDNCGTVTATLLTSELAGGNCAWTATYTFDVTDGCSSVSCTVVYEGGDETAPDGTAPLAVVDMDACAVTAEVDYPFDAAYAVAGYSDNCGEPVTVTLTNTQFDGDDCGWIITYTFSIWDECDNELADQYYTVSGSDQTEPTGVMPMAVTDVDACLGEVGVTAALFDAAYAVSVYTDNCGGTVTATNVTSDIGGTDCGWTITYTFDVEDVCGNALTGQYYTISGSDVTDPEIFACPEGVIQVTVSSGCDYEADDRWDVTATDNCTDTPTLTYTLTGDTDSGGPVTASTLEGVLFEIGTTVVTWSATDACGNNETCTFTVQVTEGAPSFVEPLVENQEVDVNDNSSCTYTHSGDVWDPELYPSCVTLTLSWELTGATEDSGSNTLDGVVFNAGVTTVTWTATDGILSSTHAYTVTVLPTALSGFITYYKYDETDLPLGGLTVRLLDGATPVATTTTDVTGYYEFTNQADLLAADRVEVSTTIPHGGLSSGDALAVSLRVAETPPVYWGPETPVDYVKFLDHVGDVHTPLGTLNTTDAFYLFRRHVGLEDEFVAGDWAFYATNDETIFTNSSANTAYRMYDMSYCEMDISVRTFGDVRGTYSPVVLKSLIPVQSDEVMNVMEGETFELPVSVDQNIVFNAVSFYLDYASDKLDILEVKSDIPGMTTMIENGKIRVEWYDLASQSLSAGNAFITLVARTIGEVTPADVLFNLGSASEFVDATAQTIPDVDVSVSSLNAVNTVTGITDPDQLNASLDAYPNPFRHELTLRYAIPEAGMVKISVVNLLGSEVATLVNHQHDAGEFTHAFRPDAVSMEYGVYFVRFQVVGESIQTSRIVKIIYNK